MKIAYEKRPDPPLAPLVIVSFLAHALFFGVFMIASSRNASADERSPEYAVQQVDLVYADQIGSGVWGTPKQGPAHDGKISLPEPAQPVQVPNPNVANTVKISDPRNQKKLESSHTGPDIPDPLRQAINSLNAGREGEYTRPNGDPNSANPGPGGPPGGDICAVYRSRASRLIRRSGSVPEANGKSATVIVVIGAGGGVASKRITSSSGVPHADSVALSLVPGTFGAPPAECGNVSLTVRVRFHGENSAQSLDDTKPKNRSRQPSGGGDDAIQHGLDSL